MAATMEIKVTGCPYDDGDVLSAHMHALEMQGTIHEVREYIRSTLKHDDLMEDEEEYLYEILEMLHIPGVE